MISAAVTCLLSILFCGIYLQLAQRWRIVDHPNERSSHHRPTPNGGGVPLLLAFFAGAGLLAWHRGLGDATYTLVLALTLLLMLAGVIDDLRGLSVRLRLSLYGLCCLAVSGSVILPDPSAGIPPAGLLGVCGAAVAMLWMMNLYNFMDGLDGFAATQCVLAGGGAAVLSRAYGGSDAYVLCALLLAAAHLGFLVWNWPPARLFMGDAGSVPSGFLLAALALVGQQRGDLPLACWLILLAVFITDASWTLLWRVVTGQPFTRPHRLHGYQRLSRHWGGHRPVDLLLLAVNLLWLLPLGAAALQWPSGQVFLVILAYIPLLAGMAKIAKFA